MNAPQDTFWLPRVQALATTGLPHMHRMMERTGRLGNLRIAAGEPGEFAEGFVFDDSDVYKWLEACAYALAVAPNDALRETADATIALVRDAQREDGYLNTTFQVARPGEAWTDLSGGHEMYCAGHLIEAAVAWCEALGDDRLLGVAERFAALIYDRFGPEGDPALDGHPEIELALQRLWEVTADDRWRDLANLLLDRRGARPSPLEAELRARDVTRSAVVRGRRVRRRLRRGPRPDLRAHRDPGPRRPRGVPLRRRRTRARHPDAR